MQNLSLPVMKPWRNPYKQCSKDIPIPFTERARIPYSKSLCPGFPTTPGHAFLDCLAPPRYACSNDQSSAKSRVHASTNPKWSRWLVRNSDQLETIKTLLHSKWLCEWIIMDSHFLSCCCSDAKLLEGEINGSICAATSSSLAWLSLSCLLRILGYS